MHLFFLPALAKRLWERAGALSVVPTTMPTVSGHGGRGRSKQQVAFGRILPSGKADSFKVKDDTAKVKQVDDANKFPWEQQGGGVGNDTPYYLQGNEAFETKKAMAARAALMREHGVRKAINNFYRMQVESDCCVRSASVGGGCCGALLVPDAMPTDH